MKNASFIAIFIVGIIASSAVAANAINPSSGMQQERTNTRTTNEGTDNQIQTTNNNTAGQPADISGEQTQTASQQEAQNGGQQINQTQNQSQTQNQMQDQANTQQSSTDQQVINKGNPGNSQIQSQNQINNSGNTDKIQNKQQTENKNNNGAGNAQGQQNRSQVANAVQEMLKIAERNGGIGQQVRLIAQAQNQNQENIENNLNKAQGRNSFVKFLIGPNYGELKKANKILANNREQIEQLNEIKNQLTNKGDQTLLSEQIKTLEQANLEIENSINSLQKGFSLLGWLFRMF